LSFEDFDPFLRLTECFDNLGTERDLKNNEALFAKKQGGGKCELVC
jgi:hypothetical protein